MSIISWIIDSHDYILKQWGDPRLEGYYFTGSFWGLLAVIIAYLCFVTFLGPTLMEKRKPFNLKSAIIIYNIIQVICCAYLFIMITIYVLPHTNVFCAPCDRSQTVRGYLTSKLMYQYFLLKITDFLDTIFFVLKKSNRQITFLHVYHHVMMAICSWIGVELAPGGSSIYLEYINSFVHMVMYSYYLLCVVYGTSKVSWFKKQVTRLQLVQFCCLIVIYASPLLQPTCAYPRWTCWLSLVLNGHMLYAFGNFYHTTYIKHGKEKPVKAQ
ncbi:hypothetical protein AMK59_8244 [Oryctes borbonicus]|uniref:Elongation of very long chain fatty acids protein n=1 Tax=Oryctes borbonicus TaxID=1629725 RepID=A0A0T6AXF5_9SCAR|nr:hypothetical protein AMK59_8244 [Oryctes borbonicus]